MSNQYIPRNTGAEAYELLCGKPPFQSTDPMELFHNHIAIKPAPPGQINPDIPGRPRAAIENITMIPV